MAAPSWTRIEALFADALERPADERDRFLDEACPGDGLLRDEARRMLAAHERGVGLLLERQLVPDGSADDPLIGQRFGAFRLVRRIGEGGMGAVYLAERADGEFAQQVAIKVVRAIGARRGEVVERFRHERRILAALDHPGIARLVDGGLGPFGEPYLAMEYVDGEPITTYASTSGGADAYRQPAREVLVRCPDARGSPPPPAGSSPPGGRSPSTSGRPTTRRRS